MILTHTPENVKHPKLFKDVHELCSDESESDGFDRLTCPTTQQEVRQRKAQGAGGDARQIEDGVGDG